MKRLTALFALFLLLHLSACGMLLYPERRGQTSGRVDPVVAILDGIGLLVFLVPGIIAFGVDIATGTIYLPPARRSSPVPGAVRSLTGSAPVDSLDALATSVSRAAGRPVDLQRERIWVYRCNDRRELETALIRLGV